MYNVLKTKVLKEDIKKGVKGNCNSCALARAIKRDTKIDNVSVGVDSINVDGIYYKTTKKAEKFIEAFDNGKKLKPSCFTFLKE